ncbi:MAG: helix-turn-helix domain-containing protein [bacterium]|nr:helix-turn-helix domain-containing protein [bacterium]
MTKIRNQSLLKKFGYHLRDLRQERSLTQEELANKADIPINQIGRIERGEVNATISTLNSISIALGIDLATLVTIDKS